MPPEVKMERATTSRNFTVIRATPAQTALLRASYSHSNVASREQLAELSEQTGLPQKWIHQWFGRQRTKDRRGSRQPNSTPGAPSNRSGSPTSAHPSGPGPGPGLRSSSAYSHDSILHIKSESGDLGSFLSSSEIPSRTGSEYLGTVSASSSSRSMIVDEPHVNRDLAPALAPRLAEPGAGQASKKKRKSAQVPKDTMSTSNTRTLRSRTKKGPANATQSTIVKKEMIEETLLENISTAQPPPGQSAASSRKFPGAGSSQAKMARSAPRPTATASVHRHALLPMIAPAKRSPITVPNVNVVHQGTGVIKSTGSRLSIDQSDSIYAAYSSSGVQLPQAQVQLDERQATDFLHAQTNWNSRTQTQTTVQAYHYDKPVFHTRFQNNGPSDFVNNNVNVHGPTTCKEGFSSVPMVNVFDSSGNIIDIGTENFPPVSSLMPSVTEMNSRRPAPFPLGPAFDWYNPIPSDSNTCESQAEGAMPLGSSSSPNLPDDAKKLPLQFRFAKPGPNALGVAIDQLITELDPSVAPQKHLLDILYEHQDENGNYTVDERLIGTLLGDVPPFYKAMGLAFLSKLGFEWVQQSVV